MPAKFFFNSQAKLLAKKKPSAISKTFILKTADGFYWYKYWYKYLSQTFTKIRLGYFLARLKDTVQSIQRRHPIGFCHGRIVKGGIHKILKRLFRLHHRLTNMNNLRGMVAIAMDAQDF